MFQLGCLIACKDLRILWRSRGAFAQALLLGLVLIFIFSLSRRTGEVVTPREAAAFFWLSSIFCQTFIFNQLYSIEETTLARQGLLLLPAPAQGIWLGKMLASLLALILAQFFFLTATIIFLNQGIAASPFIGLTAILASDIGICSLGSLLGATACGRFSRQSLPAIILFPMLVPLLLAAIGLGAQCLGDAPENQAAWLGMIAAFDCLFGGASLLLFGFVYGGEN